MTMTLATGYWERASQRGFGIGQRLPYGTCGVNQDGVRRKCSPQVWSSQTAEQDT